MIMGHAGGITAAIALSLGDGVCAASVPELPQPLRGATSDATSLSGLASAKRHIAGSAGSVAASCAGTICARDMAGATITGVQSVVVVL